MHAVNKKEEIYMLKTQENEDGRRDMIAKASIVIRHKFDEPCSDQDIAIIAIKEKDLPDNFFTLKPIDIKFDEEEGNPATIVGGRNNTISTGYILKYHEQIRLPGGEHEPGDSGSPYLVEENNKLKAIAVNTLSHDWHLPTGVALTKDLF